MKKRVLSLILCVVLYVSNYFNIAPVEVSASEKTSTIIEVCDSSSLVEALENGGSIVLQQDITTGALNVGEDSIVDLNGHKLTAEGIVIAETKTFTIMDSQYTDSNPGNGKLVTKGEEYKAGIQTTNATLIIESGVIEATGSAFGAGIGGSKGDSNCAGKVIINDGVVAATGGNGACGIGGGADFRTEKRGGHAGVVIINGGTVVANGGLLGIGGGDGYWPCGMGGHVTINGGKITTKGIVVIAGDLNINGGTVETIDNSVINASTVSLKNCTVIGNNSYAGIYDGAGNCTKEQYEILVTSNLGGTTLGGGIKEAYATVELCATPDIGYIFDGWYENGVKVSDDICYSFIVTSNRNLEAQFTEVILHTISIDGERQLDDMFIVECDKTLELTVLPNPSNAFIDKSKIQWSTSDSTIATVENGIVKGIQQGQVTISASIKGKSATCMLTVIPERGYNKCSYCSGEGRTKCTKCDRYGRKRCNPCSGDGIVSTSESCNDCNGTGNVSTYKECQICHGTGFSFNETLQKYVICKFCNGTGEFLYTSNCETCQGTGKVTGTKNCITCKGKGWYECSECDNGYNECYSCSGVGQVRCKLYAISYDANGGINPPYTQVKVENRNIQIDDTIPERNGYIFCGWALENTAKTPKYKIGDYITEDVTVKLYAVWEQEKTLYSIGITQMPAKINYIEGESFDTTGLVVTAYYSNNTTENITDYEITGYHSTPGEKKIIITYEDKTVEFIVTVKSKTPQVITTDTYKVSDTVISKITIGTTAKEFLGSINENQYVRIFMNQTEVKNDDIVGTGMVLKIMEGNEVVKTYKIVVTGDINGDGNVTVTDMLTIKAHVLGKNKLSDEYAMAADTSGDNTISITDFIQVKAKILGKGNITAR